jgi:hypothetical protein
VFSGRQCVFKCVFKCVFNVVLVNLVTPENSTGK